MSTKHDVKLSPSLIAAVNKLPIKAQINLDGGLVRPLRRMGFEFVYEVFLRPTSVLTITWIEPTEDMSYRRANAILSVPGHNLGLQIEMFENDNILLSGT